jgi:hypothetical protein
MTDTSNSDTAPDQGAGAGQPSADTSPAPTPAPLTKPQEYTGAAKVFLLDDDGEQYRYVSSGIGYVLAEHIEQNDCEEDLDQFTLKRLDAGESIKIHFGDAQKGSDVPVGGSVTSDERGWYVIATAAQWAAHVEGKEHGTGRYSLYNAEQISSSVY